MVRSIVGGVVEFGSDRGLFHYPVYGQGLGVMNGDLLYDGGRYFSVSGLKCIGFTLGRGRSGRCDEASFRDEVSVLRGKCCSRVLARVARVLDGLRGVAAVLSIKYNRKCCSEGVGRLFRTSVITFSVSGSTVSLTSGESNDGSVG